MLGAAGGVGLAAVQLGKLMGARVIAAASSPEKLETCKASGADLVIDYAQRGSEGARQGAHQRRRRRRRLRSGRWQATPRRPCAPRRGTGASSSSASPPARSRRSRSTSRCSRAPRSSASSGGSSRCAIPARALAQFRAAVRVGARRQARAARARHAAAGRRGGGDAHAPRPQGAGQNRPRGIASDIDHGHVAGHRTRPRAHQGRHLHVALRAFGDVLEADGQQGLLQAREPADDRLLQGARRAQQDPHAHAPRRRRAA